MRNAASEREILTMRWGMPPPPRVGDIQSRRSATRRRSTGGLKTGRPLLGSSQQLRGVCAGAEPRDQEKDVVWFALNEYRPLFAFAGIWTEFKGDPDDGTERSGRADPPQACR